MHQCPRKRQFCFVMYSIKIEFRLDLCYFLYTFTFHTKEKRKRVSLSVRNDRGSAFVRFSGKRSVFISISYAILITLHRILMKLILFVLSVCEKLQPLGTGILFLGRKGRPLNLLLCDIDRGLVIFHREPGILMSMEPSFCSKHL